MMTISGAISDVCSEDNSRSLCQFHQTGVYEADHHNGCSVGGLNQRGKENTDQKTDHTVLRKYLQNASHLGSGNLLQSFTHQLHSI